MNVLDQNLIINRMKTDACLIAKDYEVDVTATLAQKLQDVKIEQLEKHSDCARSSGYSFRNLIMPIMGVAALTLVFINFTESVSNVKVDNNTSQVDVTQVTMNQLNPNINLSVNDVRVETQALEQDILHMAQVFSL